jgi:hypothetical protein
MAGFWLDFDKWMVQKHSRNQHDKLISGVESPLYLHTPFASAAAPSQSNKHRHFSHWIKIWKYTKPFLFSNLNPYPIFLSTTSDDLWNKKKGRGKEKYDLCFFLHYIIQKKKNKMRLNHIKFTTDCFLQTIKIPSPLLPLCELTLW